MRKVKPDNPLMEDELFGPILPIMTFESIEEAVNLINTKPRPLALYLFSANKSNIEYVKSHTLSGGMGSLFVFTDC